MPQIIETDIVIVGGGIAGLWLFRSLSNRGYRALLLEQDTLGGGQTIKSQGIIHGGTKYTLSGQLTNAAQAIAAMPIRWRTALNAENSSQGTSADPSLAEARVLSQYHYLWSPGNLSSRLTSFFASKALSGRVDALQPADFPEIFKNPQFNGSIYRLNEIVLDISSVVRALIQGIENRIIKVDWHPEGNARLLTDKCHEIAGIALTSQTGKQYQIKASRYIFTAGEGTADLLKMWQIKEPKMQVRPLQMVMVRHNHPVPIYAHCLGATAVPRMTITSHPDKDGKWVWYLGGGIAEKGVGQAPDKLIATAQKELKQLLPWVDLSNAEWSTLSVNRAEPKQNRLLRPDEAFCQPIKNVIVTWPTKLALAPDLSDQVSKLLYNDRVTPHSCCDFTIPEGFEQPEVCPNFWQGHFE